MLKTRGVKGSIHASSYLCWQKDRREEKEDFRTSVLGQQRQIEWEDMLVYENFRTLPTDLSLTLNTRLEAAAYGQFVPETREKDVDDWTHKKFR